MFKKLETSSYNVLVGTSLSGYLPKGINYHDLVEAFGKPTFDQPSSDNKIQKEWVFTDKEGNVFTIYDWKTYDVNFTKFQYDRWHVGSKKTNAAEFIDWVTSEVQRLRPIQSGRRSAVV